MKDNRIISITTKKEKINDKVLSVTSDYIEFENLGRYSIDSNIKGYRLYNTLNMCTLSDIPIGYSTTDFCVRDNKICAILIAKEEVMENIRILLQASDLIGSFLDKVYLKSEVNMHDR